MQGKTPFRDFTSRDKNASMLSERGIRAKGDTNGLSRIAPINPLLTKGRPTLGIGGDGPGIPHRTPNSLQIPKSTIHDSIAAKSALQATISGSLSNPLMREAPTSTHLAASTQPSSKIYRAKDVVSASPIKAQTSGGSAGALDC